MLHCFRLLEVEHRNVSSIFTLQYDKLDHHKCKVFLLDTIKIYYNIVLLLYVFSAIRGVVYILVYATKSQEWHICSTHKLLVKSTFPKYLIKNHPKQPLRYPLRQNPLKSSISPLPTKPKITTIPLKIPSKP